jgi:hypothetical protein
MKRVEKLRDFWETVSRPPLGLPLLEGVDVRNEYTHRFVNQLQSLWTLLAGAPGFFTPRVPPPFFSPPGHIEALSFYDVSPLRATLEHLVDFDLINNGSTHLSLGAVNVQPQPPTPRNRGIAAHAENQYPALGFRRLPRARGTGPAKKPRTAALAGQVLLAS